MSDPRVTEERIKCWLDTNQVQRERLCLHLLPLFGNYTEVTPRRPKGGPDGARDIQAVFDGSLQVWGAVGFQNTANDSNQNKTWVKNKFNEDLQAALAQQSDLKGFVFFTNVDLTPGEQNELLAEAAKCGITHCRVFYRERLRQVLDSSEGLGYRLQYLAVPMSLEEQISFIERLQVTRAKELAALDQRQQQIGAQVERLEFLNECLRPVHEVAVALKLDRKYSPQELGHFQVAVEFSPIYKPSPYSSLFVAGCDDYVSIRSVETTTKWIGVRTVAWSTEPTAVLHDRKQVFKFLEVTDELWFRVPLHRRGPFAFVGDFDRSGFDICVSEQLVPRLEAVALVVNGFMVAQLTKEIIALAHDVGLVENSAPIPPLPLAEESERLPWRRLYIRAPETSNEALPPSYRHYPKELHFSQYTPVRLPIPPETGGELMGSVNFVVE